MQKRFRLRRTVDFQRLRQEGRTWAHPLLVLGAVPNGLPHNRYGIITSRRLGSAVRRNRARRRLREAVRHWHPNLKEGYDVVLIARDGVLECAYADLLQAVRALCARAGLLAP